MKISTNRLKLILTSLISIFLTLVLCVGIALFLVSEYGSVQLKFNQIKSVIDNYYIGDYDYFSSEDAMFDGFVDSLGDKYSEYYNSDETDEKNQKLEGRFHGIGIVVTKHPDNKTMYVTHVYNDSSAAKAGITRGDEIIKVGNISVKEDYSGAFELLKGLKDEKITIELFGKSGSKAVEVSYSDCTIQSVYYQLIEGFGYIEITSFNDATVNQFKDAVDNLIADSAKGLIFDLRGNGGGTVDSVSSMLDYICPEGVLMYVKYANDEEKTVLKKSDSEHFVDLPMVVLTDSSTASASELFAANIRDFNLGALIGDTTYGKGVMQKTYRLYDGSSVKTTVAEFFAHSGVSFNGVGLKPDEEVKLSAEEQKNNLILQGADSPYVKAAVKWLNERKK